MKNLPEGKALVEIFREVGGAKQKVREFLFPGYKIWNIQAHFSDIVDGELLNSLKGYEMAASNGLEFLSRGKENNEQTN